MSELWSGRSERFKMLKKKKPSKNERCPTFHGPTSTLEMADISARSNPPSGPALTLGETAVMLTMCPPPLVKTVAPVLPEPLNLRNPNPKTPRLAPCCACSLADRLQASLFHGAHCLGP